MNEKLVEFKLNLSIFFKICKSAVGYSKTIV